MTHIIHGILGRFEKASLAETDDAAEKRRKLTLIVIALVTCFTGIVSFVRAFIAEGLSTGAVLSGVYVGIVGGAAPLFFLNKRFAILLYGFLFAILRILTIFFWSEGGLAGQAGVGIPEDQIKGLFDPGFTEEGGRVKASPGLFASFQIIRKHRGEIRVESEDGKGTTFTVLLPVH